MSNVEIHDRVSLLPIFNSKEGVSQVYKGNKRDTLFYWKGVDYIFTTLLTAMPLASTTRT